MECLEKRLSVMDSTAFSLCMDNRMPILVFDLQQKINRSKPFLVKQLVHIVAN